MVGTDRRRACAGSPGPRPRSTSPGRPARSATSCCCAASSRTCAGGSSAPSCSRAADELGVELVVTLGALLAETPHTRPIPVSGTATELDLEDRLKLEPSTYEGPTGIVGVSRTRARRLDMPGGLVLGRRPPLRRRSRRAPRRRWRCSARSRTCSRSSIPLGDLPEEARAWERGVAELAEEDEESRSTSATLEETQDTAELPEASGEAIAREFERYLKRRDDPDDATGELRSARARRRGAASTSALTTLAAPGFAGVAGVSVASAQASTARQRARGVEVVGERGAARRCTTAAVGAAPSRATAARHLPSRAPRRPRVGVGPLPVGAVVVARAAPAGSPSGRRPPRAASRRAPGCPWTSTSSRRRARPSRRARRPGRTVLRVGDLGLGGAHLVVREDQVAAAALDVERARRGGRSAIAEHSMCQPGRPRPERRVPGRLARAAAARQSRQSSGSFLPGRSGSPPRSANTLEHRRSRSRPETVAEARVGASPRSRRRRRPS